MPVIELTEKSNPATADIDLMSAKEIARAINREDQKIALAISNELDSVALAIDAAATAVNNGGRLGYFGAGTSGRIGILDASEIPPTYSVSADVVQAFIAGGEQAVRFGIENAEDNIEFAKADFRKFAPRPQDIVISISASGNPAYVITVLEEAQKLGIKTIGISSNPNAKIKQFSDIFICPDVGPEAVTGSSRMKSGTAQKMILNMITTGAMIRIGKTFKNYMIDVCVSNHKLYDRACRIVSEIAGVEYSEAEKYLAASQNKVKIACIMAAKKCSRQEALKLLETAHGILRKII